MLRTIISSCPEFEITCAILNDCLSKLLSRESQREYWGCLGGYLALRRVDFGFYKRYQVMRRTVGTVEVCHRGRYSLEDEELKAVYFPILTRYVDFDIPRRWHVPEAMFFRSGAKSMMGMSTRTTLPCKYSQIYLGICYKVMRFHCIVFHMMFSSSYLHGFQNIHISLRIAQFGTVKCVASEIPRSRRLVRFLAIIVPWFRYNQLDFFIIKSTISPRYLQ